MNKINDTLFAHWNTDSLGNPLSVSCSETQIVSPIHLCVQLNQIPDDFQSFEVKDGETLLSEVFDTQEIGVNNYKVDYGDGIVWFNKEKGGHAIAFKYSGRGWKSISSKRVTLEDGDLIGVSSLHDLVELNKQAVQSINTIQANFDNTIVEITEYANQAKNKILSQQNSSISRMNDYVAQVDDYVRTTKYNISLIVAETTAIMSENNELALKYKAEINEVGSSALALITRSHTEVINSMNSLLQDVLVHAQSTTTSITQSRESTEQLIVTNLNEFNKFKTQQESIVTSAKDEFLIYLQIRKEEMELSLKTALFDLDLLIKTMSGKQLEFTQQFADSQLDRLNQFTSSQNSHQTTFDNTQMSNDLAFDNTQNVMGSEFDAKMTEYGKVFGEMVNQVLDENAIANLQQKIDVKVDEVTSEDVLELQYENGKVVGSIGGQKLTFYTNNKDELGNPIKQKIKEMIVSGKQAIHIGDVEPVDVEQIWFDTSDENIDTMEFPESQVLQEFQETVQRVLEKVEKIDGATRMDDLWSGRFSIDGTDSINTESGTVAHVRIKVGVQPNLRQLEEGELAYCTDTGKLYIGARLNPLQTTITNVQIGGGNSGSGDDTSSGNSGNLTGQYVELYNNKNTKYRVLMGEDGNMKIRESSYYTADNPSVNDSPNFTGLIINRYYGGGAKNNGQSPVSHGFIELYNNNSSRVTMNLKGLSLYYKSISDPVWRQLKLDGYIPYQHSFLIRCAQHNDPLNSTCRLHIDEYDMDWSSQALSNESCMIYLAVGTDAVTIANPYRVGTTGKQAEGYIDLMACSSEGLSTALGAFEDGNDGDSTRGYYRRYLNIDTGIQRIDFQDTNIAYNDYEPVNYKTCNINIYRPRCFDSGVWDAYYNKIKLNERVPNLLNIQYGKTWDVRTFTWQSGITDSGCIKYRKEGLKRWNIIDTDKRIVYHHDQDCTIHSVIIKGLEEGIYEYQCGEEGAFSELSTFEVKNYTAQEDEHIKFLQVSDQQAWYEEEYGTWKWACKYIEHNERSEDYDFVLNTGDISQNANRELSAYIK